MTPPVFNRIVTPSSARTNESSDSERISTREPSASTSTEPAPPLVRSDWPALIVSPARKAFASPARYSPPSAASTTANTPPGRFSRTHMATIAIARTAAAAIGNPYRTLDRRVRARFAAVHRAITAWAKCAGGGRFAKHVTKILFELVHRSPLQVHAAPSHGAAPVRAANDCERWTPACRA